VTTKIKNYYLNENVDKTMREFERDFDNSLVFENFHGLRTYGLEPLYYRNSRLMTRETNEVLNEGLKEILVDGVQFILAAATEYGVTAVTVGGGAPAGTALETVIDAGFTVESIASLLSGLNSAASAFGELEVIFDKVMSLDLKAGFESFYETIKEIWQTAADLVPKLADKMGELIEKAKKGIKQLISKIADVISDIVKFLVPDAIIGTAAGEGLQKILEKVAENAYSMLTSGISQLGEYAKLVTDPGYAVKFFNDLFTDLFAWLEEIQTKMAEKPEDFVDKAADFAKKAAAYAVAGPLGAMAMGDLGEKAFGAVVDFLKEKQPDIIDLVDKITRIVFPLTFAMLASYQILMKGEYQETEEKAGTAAGKALKKVTGKKKSVAEADSEVKITIGDPYATSSTDY
jgi:NTP pyrophosphatase (non-canonical NTP hydrolase)